MGYSDKVRGVDGKNYMVSTAQKFDTWETAVFQAGVFGVMMGKGLCFAEATLGDQPGEAMLTHTRAVGMVMLLPRDRWEMSPGAIQVQQTDAAEYVSAPSAVKPLMLPLPRNLPSVNAIRENSAYGPGTAALLDWLDTLLHLDYPQWGKAAQAAVADHGWADEATFRVAAAVVEANAGMRAGVGLAAAASGMAAARAGAADQQQASFILAFVRNAAVAVLTRHAIPDVVFAKLYAPFMDVMPPDGSSPSNATPRRSAPKPAKRRVYRQPAGEPEVSDDEVVAALLEHLIPRPAAKSLGVSTKTVEARMEEPDFRVKYWPQEIVRRVEVDFALRVHKVQPPEGGLDFPTIKGAFAEVNDMAVQTAADAYKGDSDDGKDGGVLTGDRAQAEVEAILAHHIDSLKKRDGREWVLGPEETEEERAAFFDKLYRGEL